MLTTNAAFLPGFLCRPGDPSTDKILQELLQKFVIDPDPVVRTIGAEALGRLWIHPKAAAQPALALGSLFSTMVSTSQLTCVLVHVNDCWRFDVFV
jgi:hypothetical protein